MFVAWLTTASCLAPSSRRTWVKQATAGAFSTGAAVVAGGGVAPASAGAAADPNDVVVQGTLSIFDWTIRPSAESCPQAAVYITVKAGGKGSRVGGLMRGNTGAAAGAVR